LDKGCEVLSAAEVNNDYQHCWKRLRAQEYFSKSEIILGKILINWHDISFVAVEVQCVARDAFNILEMCDLRRKQLTHQVECIKN